MRQIKRFLLGTTLTDDVMARAIEKYEENVTSRRCGRATLAECDPLPPEARGMNVSTAGPHQTYNSWRARSWFEHAKQAKVGGQSASPKACLAFPAERKQQRMLSGRPERPPFPLSRFFVHALSVLLVWFIARLPPTDAVRLGPRIRRRHHATPPAPGTVQRSSVRHAQCARLTRLLDDFSSSGGFLSADTDLSD